ncbi:MAG: bifunctional 2-amino-4-hydroxy-6-hydroxymethyldihydropteridine diphosphokinase/deoxynucleoside kinase [Bacteroidetes bacterium]|jgi:deoxyguanosine kinase|nr:MAG: bifunctional 2-amino-4-hydroxy-6-hydroxymethyldihydropteridine diphosphokinase/deoxynucleoside kinase [Bacteroidota bacterium]
MIPYQFIAIEGTIGAGKTSLATRISQDFNAKLILEQFEDNAFLPKFYEDQDKYAFPLEMSFMASRFQQLKDQLGTHDLFRNFIISDYYVAKSLIFARKTLQPDEFNLFNRFFQLIDISLPKPDLLVYLYLHVDKLQENIRKRGRSYEQHIKDEYLDQIQSGYFEFIRQQPEMRILLLDTNHLDFVSNNDDYQTVINVISREYPFGVHRITF